MKLAPRALLAWTAAAAVATGPAAVACTQCRSDAVAVVETRWRGVWGDRGRSAGPHQMQAAAWDTATRRLGKHGAPGWSWPKAAFDPAKSSLAAGAYLEYLDTWLESKHLKAGPAEAYLAYAHGPTAYLRGRRTPRDGRAARAYLSALAECQRRRHGAARPGASQP